MIYKVVTKILANRLKRIMPLVIAPTQYAFIPGRNSSNNLIVAQEILHKMRHSSSNKGFVAIQLELEEAHDRLSWQFVVDSFRMMGLNYHFISII